MRAARVHWDLSFSARRERKAHFRPAQRLGGSTTLIHERRPIFRAGNDHASIAG